MDIALWNQSTKLKDEDGQLIADACDLQMREDVGPAYGLEQPPKVSFYDSSHTEADLPADCLVIIFSENLDTTTNLVAPLVGPAATINTRDDKGRRFGRVYVGTIRANGGTFRKGARSVSAATSHECIEYARDPDATQWVWDAVGKKLVAVEVCDPVEEDAYNKRVGHQVASVSNFVHTAWSDARAPAGSRFDQMRKLKAPFTASKGGYLIVCDENDPRPHPDPPQAAGLARLAGLSSWKDDDKGQGFARSRVRVVW
jgi:hypothetical protein